MENLTWYCFVWMVLWISGFWVWPQSLNLLERVLCLKEIDVHFGPLVCWWVLNLLMIDLGALCIYLDPKKFVERSWRMGWIELIKQEHGNGGATCTFRCFVEWCRMREDACLKETAEVMIMCNLCVVNGGWNINAWHLCNTKIGYFPFSLDIKKWQLVERLTS